MSSFHTFASVEEADMMMRTEAALALKRALPEQRKITGGDHWMRLADGLTIFGYVFTFDEAMRGEIEAGATKREAASGDQALRTAHAEGYRFGKAFSLAAPNGELGSTHVIDMMKISAAEFEVVRHEDWNIEAMLDVEHRWAIRLVSKWNFHASKLNGGRA